MPILLINLLGASDRRRTSLARLRALSLGATVLRAVDGQTLTSEARASYSEGLNRLTFKRPLSDGEIGCYLSHYEAWKIAAAGNGPVAILEDDFEADAAFPDVLNHLLDWPLPDAIIKLDAEPRRARLLGRVGMQHALVDPWITPSQTTGYVVTPRAARALVGAALPFGRPVDMDLKHWWELGVRVLAVSPGIVRQSPESKSQIDEARLVLRNSVPRFERLCRNIRFQCRFHTNLLCARNGIGPLHRGVGPPLRNAVPT